MIDARHAYDTLGMAIAQLDEPSFAQDQGFIGEATQIRQLRTAHARAFALKPTDIVDLGRLIADYFSPSSEVAAWGEALSKAVRQD